MDKQEYYTPEATIVASPYAGGDEKMTYTQPQQQQPVGPPIPPGHSRYYCEKCQMHYDLPAGATSWRCVNCQTFNSTVPPECPCCNIQ